MFNRTYSSTSNILNASLPIAIASVLMVTVAAGAHAATITEASVNNYATTMRQAANSKNISQVAKLVSDDALISMSRKGKTTSLDKSAYLRLLQDSWSQTSNYQYDIQVSNIVISGNQAKANVVTVEKWVKDGSQTTLTTSSRATLKADNNNAVLLRAVAQVSIE